MARVATKLPAGTYWIGDPCYVLGDVNGFDWNDLLEENDLFRVSGNARGVGLFSVRHPITKVLYHIGVSDTAWGDGVYKSNIGEHFGVDAGMLAVIPVQLLYTDETTSIVTKVNAPDFKGKDLGVVRHFSEPFSVDYQNGTVVFGDVVIYTDGDYPEC